MKCSPLLHVARLQQSRRALQNDVWLFQSFSLRFSYWTHGSHASKHHSRHYITRLSSYATSLALFSYPFLHFLSLSIGLCMFSQGTTAEFSVLFLFYTNMSTTLRKLKSIKHKDSCFSCTCAPLKSMLGPALGVHTRQASDQRI